MNNTHTLIYGDSLEELKRLTANSIDCIVTDGPYELGFMGKAWDRSGIVYSVTLWAEALRVLKPGGYLLSFSSARTYHRMTCAVEDAGFEIRDQIMWVYGSGFPKSLDIGKALDKAAGAERELVAVGNPVKRMIPGADQDKTGSWIKDNGREYQPSTSEPVTDAAQQWQGWGTALKPAHEPICVARKPLVGTVVANVLAHGVGGINVDGCRVGVDSPDRWPANFIHDGSDDVLAEFPETKSGGYPPEGGQRSQLATYGTPNKRGQQKFTSNEGSAARFFYCAKASKADRGTGNNHPTVKPIALMCYLVRLVCPPGGVCLDLFNGSGSTGVACAIEGFSYKGIDDGAPYILISYDRISEKVPCSIVVNGKVVDFELFELLY